MASNRELPLGDGGPSLDANPLRWAAPVPFCVLLGLAVAGATLRGWRGTGGWLVWGMVLACAASPVVFYVASRYRLALAVALCLPAGAGAVSLVQSFSFAGPPTKRSCVGPWSWMATRCLRCSTWGGCWSRPGGRLRPKRTIVAR